MERLALDKNSLTTIDLSPLANCKRLYKLYLYHNYLSEIDLTPLKELNELGVIFLNGNRFSKIDLCHLPSNIKRVGIEKKYEIINANHILGKITYETETRPQIIYDNNLENDQDYGYEDDFAYQGAYERSPNDQRSDVMNPNNPEHQAAIDNRANQLNPQHPAYRSYRGKK